MISTTQVLAPSVARPTAPQVAVAVTRSLASVGSTDVINQSVTGKLIGFAINVDTPPDANCSAKVKINVDGNGAVDALTFYSAGQVFTSAGKGFATIGDGDATDDRIVVWLNVDFAASIVLAVETTSAASAGQVTVTGIYSQTF